MQVRRVRGGRTVFFRDLDGHLLEIRTRTSRREAEDAVGSEEDQGGKAD